MSASSEPARFVVACFGIAFAGLSISPPAKADSGVSYVWKDSVTIANVDTLVYDVLGDGRLLLLAGDELMLETGVGTRSFAMVHVFADGTISPFGAAFLRVSPDGNLIALGDGQFPGRVGIFEVPSVENPPLAGNWFDFNHFDAEWYDGSMLMVTDSGVVVAFDVIDALSTIIINGINGGSAGITFDAEGNLFTGNGFSFGDPVNTGFIRAFDHELWTEALSSGNALDFETAGAFVVDLLSAGSLGFDAHGNLHVGGGDLFSGTGDFGYGALVRAAYVSQVLTDGIPVDPEDPAQVRKIDVELMTEDSFYDLNFNSVTGELCFRDQATIHLLAIPNPFAAEVIEYTDSGGIYNDPLAALGPPTIDSEYFGEPAPVVPVFSAWQPAELVSIPTGGYLVLKFAEPVTDDFSNPFGLDFVVFGNAFLSTATPWEFGDPDRTVVTGGIFAEPSLCSVSPDGENWYSYDNGPHGDDFAPTLGRVYDPENPEPEIGEWNLWWGLATDPTRPLDPAWTAADLEGMTVAQVAGIYGQSAGGTGFDLAESPFEAIQYVRIEPVTGVPEVDAVVNVAADCDANGVSDPIDVDTGTALDLDANGILDLCEFNPADVNMDGDVDIIDLLAVLAAWGPCTACPEDINVDGQVAIEDLLAVLGNWN